MGSGIVCRTCGIGGRIARRRLQRDCSLHVLPIFLGMGKHLRQDLPELMETLRRKHPQVNLQLAPSVGENHEVLRAIAQSAVTAPASAGSLGAKY